MNKSHRRIHQELIYRCLFHLPLAQLSVFFIRHVLQLTDLLYSSPSTPFLTIYLLQLFVLLLQQLETLNIVVDLDNAEQQDKLEMK